MAEPRLVTHNPANEALLLLRIDAYEQEARPAAYDAILRTPDIMSIYAVIEKLTKYMRKSKRDPQHPSQYTLYLSGSAASSALSGEARNYNLIDLLAVIDGRHFLSDVVKHLDNLRDMPSNSAKWSFTGDQGSTSALTVRHMDKARALYSHASLDVTARYVLVPETIFMDVPVPQAPIDLCIVSGEVFDEFMEVQCQAKLAEINNRRVYAAAHEPKK